MAAALLPLPLALASSAEALAASAEEGRMIAYMNCYQPGPTPSCTYHPYFNTVTPQNTTMNPSQQRQLSAGRAYGANSASAYDAEGQIMYFFQGGEDTMYRIDAKTMQPLPTIPLDTQLLPQGFIGVAGVVWDVGSSSLLAVLSQTPRQARLVEIDALSGAVVPLDAAVDPAKRVDFPAGLVASDGEVLVSPRGWSSASPHSLSVVNVSTGEAKVVELSKMMRIFSLEYGDGAWWAVGAVCPDMPPGAYGCGTSTPGHTTLATLDPHTGTVTPHPRANITTYPGFSLAHQAFDHANGIMYFTSDPDIVGVSVRTGEVVTSSPLVHWADGTQDAGFVLAMKFRG